MALAQQQIEKINTLYQKLVTILKNEDYVWERRNSTFGEIEALRGEERQYFIKKIQDIKSTSNLDISYNSPRTTVDQNPKLLPTLYRMFEVVGSDLSQALASIFMNEIMVEPTSGKKISEKYIKDWGSANLGQYVKRVYLQGKLTTFLSDLPYQQALALIKSSFSRRSIDLNQMDEMATHLVNNLPDEELLDFFFGKNPIALDNVLTRTSDALFAKIIKQLAEKNCLTDLLALRQEEWQKVLLQEYYTSQHQFTRMNQIFKEAGASFWQDEKNTAFFYKLIEAVPGSQMGTVFSHVPLSQEALLRITLEKWAPEKFKELQQSTLEFFIEHLNPSFWQDHAQYTRAMLSNINLCNLPFDHLMALHGKIGAQFWKENPQDLGRLLCALLYACHCQGDPKELYELVMLLENTGPGFFECFSHALFMSHFYGYTDLLSELLLKLTPKDVSKPNQKLVLDNQYLVLLKRGNDNIVIPSLTLLELAVATKDPKTLEHVLSLGVDVQEHPDILQQVLSTRNFAAKEYYAILSDDMAPAFSILAARGARIKVLFENEATYRALTDSIAILNKIKIQPTQPDPVHVAELKVLLNGYDLCLTSELFVEDPKNKDIKTLDPQQAEFGKIYINEDGDYYVRDSAHKVQKGRYATNTQGIELYNTRTLNNAPFKSTLCTEVANAQNLLRPHKGPLVHLNFSGQDYLTHVFEAGIYDLEYSDILKNKFMQDYAYQFKPENSNALLAFLKQQVAVLEQQCETPKGKLFLVKFFVNAFSELFLQNKENDNLNLLSHEFYQTLVAIVEQNVANALERYPSDQTVHDLLLELISTLEPAKITREQRINIASLAGRQGAVQLLTNTPLDMLESESKENKEEAENARIFHGPVTGLDMEEPSSQPTPSTDIQSLLNAMGQRFQASLQLVEKNFMTRLNAQNEVISLLRKQNERQERIIKEQAEAMQKFRTDMDAQIKDLQNDLKNKQNKKWGCY